VSEGTLAFLRLAVALPLVLLLCVVVLKYLVPRTLSGFAGGRRMRVVEQLSLGPKTGMSLVRVGGRYYLLAYHEGAVTVVKEMDELPEACGTETPDGLLAPGKGDSKGDSLPKAQRGLSPLGLSLLGGLAGRFWQGPAGRALQGKYARFRAGRGR